MTGTVTLVRWGRLLASPGDAECLADALEMPREYLMDLQVPGKEFDQEEYRRDAYMVLRIRASSEAHVSLHHDWWARTDEN